MFVMTDRSEQSSLLCTEAVTTVWHSVYDSGWLVLTSGIFYRKRAGILFVAFREFDAPAGTNVVGTLPSGFLPSMGFACQLASTYGAYQKMYVMIGSDGTITLTKESAGIVWGMAVTLL